MILSKTFKQASLNDQAFMMNIKLLYEPTANKLENSQTQEYF